MIKKFESKCAWNGQNWIQTAGDTHIYGIRKQFVKQ